MEERKTSTEAVRRHRARLGVDAVRERGREQMRKYRAANPHVQLVGNYRISTAQAKSIYALMQIAKCQICGDPDRKVVFDHDHKTGEFRGFLCQACNSALGSFQDSPSLLEAAISYLKLRST